MEDFLAVYFQHVVGIDDDRGGFGCSERKQVSENAANERALKGLHCAIVTRRSPETTGNCHYENNRAGAREAFCWIRNCGF